MKLILEIQKYFITLLEHHEIYYEHKKNIRAVDILFFTKWAYPFPLLFNRAENGIGLVSFLLDWRATKNSILYQKNDLKSFVGIDNWVKDRLLGIFINISTKLYAVLWAISQAYNGLIAVIIARHRDRET